jgi:uncharacterized protein with beta-barrel porin domain
MGRRPRLILDGGLHSPIPLAGRRTSYFEEDNMRQLLSFTCLTPIALLSTFPAIAETVIKDARTAGVRTATANAGAADSVTIDATGSIKLSSGTAITMDSNHEVNNKGTITITDSNGATGILALPNTSGAITNSGTITIDETYTPTDTDKDGDIDGTFAQGSGRYGIRVGAGHNGNILNSGSVTVEGNSSFGLALDGPLTGNLTNSGKIDVLGDNSFGVRAGNVSGNVVVEGTIAARGANSVGAALTGDIGGALRVQGSIAASGYRSIAAPGDVSKLDADDLLQGGNALRVSGNVAGGIILDAPPKDTDPKVDDEDKDGVKDANEGTASVTSYGSAAAFQIGATDRTITIGAVAGNAQGHGLIINGTVSGQGVYKAVDGNGLVIGGLGQAVNITGGMTVNGRIEATSLDQNATALRIGNLARVNEIVVTGSIGAAGGGVDGTRVTAIQIDAGAVTNTLSNKGVILAKVNGDKAVGAAIVDRAGTLTSVVNQGRISVEGAAGTDRAIAIDLAANTTGVTITQSRLSVTATAPEITGNILLGSGNDLVDVSAGKIAGKIVFGAGNDRLRLSAEASYSGAVSFGAGTGELSLADKASFSGSADFADNSGTIRLGGTSKFSGSITGGSGTAVTVDGGSLALLNTGTVRLASLAVGEKGTIGVLINGIGGTNTLIDVAGAAQFAAGSKVLVNLNSVERSPGVYTFLKAGTLSGAPALLTDSVSLPFLFKGQVQTNTAANTAAIVITRKSVSELGLNASEAGAFDAIAKAVDKDARVAGSLLTIRDGETLRSSLQQMLPDHAGGSFETVTLASRSTARFIADPGSYVPDLGGWGFWLQQNVWSGSKDTGNTAAYDVSGWGFTGGTEVATGVGKFGLSVGYMYGKNGHGENSNELTAGQLEGSIYWRGNWGGLNAFAKAGYGHIDFESTRNFIGTDLQGDVGKTSEGDWNGKLLTTSGGVSYAIPAGRLSIRPSVSLDYYRLTEKAYQETGGGDALDLTVDSRKSDELALSGGLALAYDFGTVEDGIGRPRFELEGGRRQILSGDLGATVARFKGGEKFTLTPEKRASGWTGAARLVGGTEGFRIGGEANVEERQDNVVVGARVFLTGAF